LPEDFEEHNEKIETGFQSKFIQKIVKIGEVQKMTPEFLSPEIPSGY